MRRLNKQSGGVSVVLVVAVLLVLAGAGAFLFSRADDQAADQSETAQNQPADTAQDRQGQTNQAEGTGETHVISYTDSGYSPAELSIKTGDTVTFKNQSDRNVWPASDVHPSHTIYSEFDPRQAVKPGEDWSFTFTRSGEWGYHDHLMPNLTGTITVE